MLNCEINSCFSLKKFCCWWILSTCLWFSLNYLLQWGENKVTLEIPDDSLTLIIFLLFGLNCYLCSKISWPSSINIDYDFSNWKYPLSILVHTLSLSSSSFIEEEHQIWYFFWVTYLLYEVLEHIRNANLLGNR